ncbi:LysR family transcriptional regulator [Sinorhizobium mexicanum]|uniref:LysR family transcriptional regulator n=1 Tax=Sinorhizobium mexicanum TaxID=375549 RepID=A0A859QW23_9HYPH|nr:LysR family transcriptional regulator [Sinorhizobium mexicanum]QLL63749.1 LysR family transcriptional regulator [Sinorhizobium mexicanum]
MDRIDAMKVFVCALDEGSLAAAGRKLNRSPAAVTRAISFLEAHVGVQLLHRTTRTIRLSEAGERYASACRRVLTDLEEADLLAAGETKAPRGTLTVTAPLVSGVSILRPILDAYLREHPEVSAKLLLLDRTVSLIDEGIDVGLRIAHLTDSTMIGIRVGEVRRVLCAAPSYLDNTSAIESPSDLSDHSCIALAQFGQESWSFPPREGGGSQRLVHIKPRLTINGVAGVVASALEGNGVTRVFSYQIAEYVKRGELRIVLAADEPPPLPVHIVAPEGRLSVPKVRAFVDFAVPRLRNEFAELSRICKIDETHFESYTP